VTPDAPRPEVCLFSVTRTPRPGRQAWMLDGQMCAAKKATPIPRIEVGRTGSLALAEADPVAVAKRMTKSFTADRAGYLAMVFPRGVYGWRYF